jgi:hypothetical protein
MRLKITELPGAFEELNALLLSNSKISVDNKQVQSSIFYQAVQNATSLNASELRCSPETLLLIAKIAATSESLTSFDFGDNDIRTIAREFAAALAESKSLQILNVRNNNIGNTAGEFAAALAASKSLHTLYASDNDIGDTAREFAAALASLSSLHILEANYNNIGAAAPEFAAALAASKSLQVLEVTHNSIGYSATEFVTALAPLTSLHKLNLWNNDIGTPNAELAVDFDPFDYYSRDELKIRQENIKQAITAFVKAIEASTSLHTLDISYNKMINANASESIKATMMTRVKKYADLANKLKDVDAGTIKLCIADFIFLNGCSQAKLQEYLQDTKIDLVKYGSADYLNTQVLELMGICHTPTKINDGEISLLLDLPRELLAGIFSWLSLFDLREIATNSTVKIEFVEDNIINSTTTMSDDENIITVTGDVDHYHEY